MGRSVLIVEDNVSMAEALRDILRGEGYDAALARDGEVALRWLASHPRPDVMLLDLLMPTMDGYTLRARQLADPAIAGIPTFVLSAGPFDARFEAMRVDGWLRKPVVLESLLSLLARHCGAGNGQRRHDVHFYASDDRWADGVAPFLADGLSRGGFAMATTTPPHAATLRDALAERGLDVAALEHSGHLMFGDVAQFLSAVVSPSGALDVGTCRMAVGRGLQQALDAAAGRPVICVGELAGVLWERGDQAAAVELERLWNELPLTSRVSALCTYHWDPASDLGPGLADVRAAHAAVV